MKNIHVLPTDKQSRIIKSQDNDFILLNTDAPNWLGINLKTTKQHIYITSDEEIKEGDWVINLNSSYAHKEVCRIDNQFELERYAKKTSNNCKKIILTTDQDLIKDGVQAIDDEFLEWFVKNPSFEFVEVTEYVDSGFSYGYKIIIPKEEIKQDLPIVNGSYGCTIQTKKQEPKQETLEELKKWKEEALIAHEINQKVIEKLMDEKKRMYSEEDLKEAFYQGSSNSEGLEFGKNRFSEWLKIFKNK